MEHHSLEEWMSSENDDSIIKILGSLTIKSLDFKTRFFIFGNSCFLN